MRPRTQKQPQVKKELCRVLDDVDVDVDVDEQKNAEPNLKQKLLALRLNRILREVYQN